MAAPEPSRSAVRLEFTKWDGTAHWHYSLTRLGRDNYGRWYGAHAGVLLQRGDQPPIAWPCDFVILVPADGNWVATFNASGKYELYIDVTGPVAIDEAPAGAQSVIRAHDLDLDVVRLRDGQVLTLDEDEFAAHQRLYGYPDDVVRRARKTADWLARQVTSRCEPFNDAGPAWLQRLAALPAGT